MSFASSINSAIFDVPSYPLGAMGSTISPALTASTAASAANLSLIPSTTIPLGRWLVTGVIFIDATTGGQTMNGSLYVQKNAANVWEYRVVSPSEDGVSVPLCCVFDSDGDDLLTMVANFTTSGGSTFAVSVANVNNLNVIRIA